MKVTSTLGTSGNTLRTLGKGDGDSGRLCSVELLCFVS